MNARINKLWVAALRSDKWRKKKGQLKGNQNYRCCLGVLNEVFMEDTGRGKWHNDAFVTLRAREDVFLGWEILDWAELTWKDGGKVTIEGKECSLAYHNDGKETRPKSFAEIADAIEKEL